MIKELSEIKKLIKKALSYTCTDFKLPFGEHCLLVPFNHVNGKLIVEVSDFVGPDFNVGVIKSEKSEYIIITSKLI